MERACYLRASRPKARHKVADFCSAPMAGFYDAVDNWVAHTVFPCRDALIGGVGMERIVTIGLCLAFFSASGCATITRGKHDVLQINTNPSGAQVQTSNGFSCASTPCAIKMPRRSELVVNITKARCQPIAINVTHRTADAGAAGVAGNVLVGGLIGLAVDASSGASQDLVPNPVEVDLACR